MGLLDGPGQLNLKDHDPNKINDHLKVQFQDVLAEPPTARSCDCVWQASYCCFHFLFSLSYGLSVCLNHICASAFWGVEFGWLTFMHVWYMTPCLHKARLLMSIPSCLCRECTRCLVDPWCEASAYMFMFFQRPMPNSRDFEPMSVY